MILIALTHCYELESFLT